MSNIRTKAIEGIKLGDTFSVSRTFTEHDVLEFADISRDYNPVHFDKRFANVKGLDGRICHGLLVIMFLSLYSLFCLRWKQGFGANGGSP